MSDNKKTHRYVRLSYNIAVGMPLYPGTPPVTVHQDKSINRSDSCNTFVVGFSNHSGTHVDMPMHFIDSGRSVCDYTMNELVFHHPVIMDCKKEPSDIIEIEDLSGFDILPETDFLMIRTGFSRFRGDRKIYSYQNPCLSPGAAEWIRNSLTGIRAVGVDFISVASRSHRNLGKKTHQTLLSTNGFKTNPVLIVEDLNLPMDINGFDQIILAPLYIESVDSAPCTVIGLIIGDE